MINNIRMQNKEVQQLKPMITVVGVGGAGGNAVNNMISSDLQGVNFAVCNTDAQALEQSLCETKMQLGATVTEGLGAGAKPEIGRLAAEESLDDVMQIMEGSNMVFITAGMGGGTGTGAAPVIARACRDKGILTVGVVTKPFHFEGTTRMRMADEGIEEMQDYVDTLIVIPNQNLFRIANEKTTFAEAFQMADSVLQSGVRGVTDLMVMPGLINLDFADVKAAMLEMGKAMMGTGEAEGDKRPIEAAEAAINNPLLDDITMKGARGVIINVTGGPDMTLFEVDEACNRIRDEVDPNANIIFGSTFDAALEGKMRVSVVATGIDAAQAAQKPISNSGGLKPLSDEKKWERAQPNTAANSPEAEQQGAKEPNVAEAAQATEQPAEMPAEAAASAMPASSPVPSGPSVYAQGNIVSPASGPAASAAGAAVRKNDEPESELFEQQDLMVSGQAPRGMVYGESFIPPAPMDAREASQYTAQTGPKIETTEAAPQQAPQAAAAPAEKQASSGIKLNPPVPGAGSQQKKRTPSLFERFTSPLRNSDAPQSEENSASPATGLRAERPAGNPSQGTLDISAPVSQRSEKSQGDDELDIPAFLRRQAN